MLILQPGCTLVVVDGVTYRLAQPVTPATVELLRDVLGWSVHADGACDAIELHSPPCRYDCQAGSEGVVTVAGS